MEGKESYTDVLVRLDQRLKDFIAENSKELGDIKVSIQELSKHCNHEINLLTERVEKVETKQANYEAIKKDRQEKAGIFQGKLREISLLIGFVTVPTGLIVTLIINWSKIASFFH